MIKKLRLYGKLTDLHTTNLNILSEKLFNRINKIAQKNNKQSFEKFKLERNKF